MQHHGLGHLPQPDNFTTCGRLGIEINQYNNPVECYADETIEEMREEKVLIDHPELADKILKTNVQVLYAALKCTHVDNCNFRNMNKSILLLLRKLAPTTGTLPKAPS